MSDAQEPAHSELPDIFTPLQQLLLLLCIGNRALLSRPNDPLPRALAELTDYDHDAVNRVQNLTDSAGFYALLRKEPETFAEHLLLGRLTYASPLGESLTAKLVPDDSADAETVAEQRAEMLAFVAHNAAWNSDLFENYLLSGYSEDDQADARQERADFRAAVEAAFADWEHTLGAVALNAPAPVVALDEDEAGWSIEPMQVQLDTLNMAVLVLRALPDLTDHPYGDAVRRLPDYHPQRLEELGEYLVAAEAGQPLPLSRAQGFLLYLAAQVVLPLFVSDLLDGGGLDDFLLNRASEEITPEMVARLRQGATIMLSAYVSLMREHESEANDFQVLEEMLEPVLALAVS